jgi:hypothetical protein
MLNVNMLNVIMLSAIMLNVVAPTLGRSFAPKEVGCEREK